MMFARVLLGFLLLYGHSFLIASSEEIEGVIFHCHDGDTCRVKVKDAMWFNVRLAGIDAPEVAPKGKGQPMGDTARDYLNNLLRNKTVRLKQTDLDPYNRPVVEVYIDNQRLVNLELVQKGYAEAYRGPAKRLNRAVYVDAEEKARREKIGIWAQTNYTSPAAFRRKKKS